LSKQRNSYGQLRWRPPIGGSTEYLFSSFIMQLVNYNLYNKKQHPSIAQSRAFPSAYGGEIEGAL
jgi:hypothetical protein